MSTAGSRSASEREAGLRTAVTRSMSGGATGVSPLRRVRTGEDGERSDLLNTQRPG